MKELEIVDGIDPRSLLEPNEVYVPWAEVGFLAQEVAIPLSQQIEKFGPFDTMVAIKHGATNMAALLERVLPHTRVRYAKLKRRESGLTVADSPPPEIEYFPANEDLEDQNVALYDEVWESGKSAVRAEHRILEANPRRLTIVTLHFKPACSIFPGRKPDIFGAEIDPRYRCYPWELWERVMQARIKRLKEAAAVA